MIMRSGLTRPTRSTKVVLTPAREVSQAAVHWMATPSWIVPSANRTRNERFKMKAELKLDCSTCIDDISLELNIKGNSMPTFSEIMRSAKSHGWRLGRDCYCPSCYQTLSAHCETCRLYEGNKTMGSPVCCRDGNFAAPSDYCKHHQPFHRHKSPAFVSPPNKKLND